MPKSSTTNSWSTSYPIAERIRGLIAFQKILVQKKYNNKRET